MTQTASQLIDDLEAFGRIGEDRVEEFEGLVDRLIQTSDPRVIPPLLDCLDDDAEFHEVMFGVVHALEAFPEGEYLESRGAIRHDMGEGTRMDADPVRACNELRIGVRTLARCVVNRRRRIPVGCDRTAARTLV